MVNIRAFLGLSYYTSTLDAFLLKFRKTHPKLSPSQQLEITKYARIDALRDNPPTVAKKITDLSKKFWNNF